MSDAARVTKPEVFISYAWGKNKERVKEIADRLAADGVKITMDVYDLQPGMNKHHFMQKLVNDPKIEKVLAFCDADYKRNADNFDGGVGEEATIISPKVYNHVNQTKFIPVVLDRDGDDKPFLPILFGSLMYFDFSDPTTEPREYQRLVRNLWECPDYRKPLCGPRPKWLDDAAVNTVGVETQLAILEKTLRRTPDATGLYVRFAQECVACLNSLTDTGTGEFDMVGMIAKTEELRNCFVRFVEGGLQQEGFDGERIGALLEKMYNGVHCDVNHPGMDEVYHFFFWDVFICVTALLLEYERFADLHALLNRTYFLRNLIGTNNDPQPYTFSRFRQGYQLLEGTYKEKAKSRAYSFAAELLVKRTYGLVITKRNLAVADVTLAHLARLYGRDENNFGWYACLAGYAEYAGYDLIWERLPSRRFCEKLFPLFDVRDLQAFKRILQQMSDDWCESLKYSGYPWCFGVPSILSNRGIDAVATMP